MSWWSKASGDAAQSAAKDYMTPDRQAQAMKMGTAAVPGGQGFQFFPVQVGGPTPYARSRKPAFIAICMYQALMAVMALIEFQNFLSGIFMTISCLVAFWAFKEDMNITYICWWGVLCVAGFIAGMVGALIGFAVLLTTIVLKFNIPLSCLFGMGLAWYLYVDYETEHHCTDTVGSWLRALGLLKEAPPPPQMSQSWLPQFGNSMPGGFDDIKKQAGSYGSMPGYGAMPGYGSVPNQQQVAGYQSQMQAQGNSAFAEASNFGSNLFGKAEGQGNAMFGQGAAMGAALPQGRHNTKSDPFMTL